MRKAHDVLGVAADADSIEIREAYVARLRNAHPDAGGVSPEPVSEIVRAYRTLRAGALIKRRAGLGSTPMVAIGMRHRRGFEPPIPRASRAAWWGRGASLLVLFIAIGATVYASSRGKAPITPIVFEANQGSPSVAMDSSWSTLDAVDGEVLREAVSAVRLLTARQGAQGLENHSRQCFEDLAKLPNLRLLDYCLAFDSAATSSMTVAGSAGRTGTEGFFHPGTMSQRHAIALRHLMPNDEAAEARHSEVEVRAVSELSMAAAR